MKKYIVEFNSIKQFHVIQVITNSKEKIEKYICENFLVPYEEKINIRINDNFNNFEYSIQI